MANSIPSGMIIQYDDGSDALQDITAFVTGGLGDFEVESLLEEKHPFGVTMEQHLPIGIGRVAPIEFTGLYDDVALGPNALFAGRVPETPASATRTFKITWRSGKTSSVETYLISYKRSADRNGLTKFTVRLQPTGAVTEA